MKEDVLVLEYQEIFGKVGIRIKHQNEDILKRNVFIDREIGVSSFGNPSFGYGDTLYIRGNVRKDDEKIDIVSKEVAEIIKRKEKLINEKYGIVKMWNPGFREDYYYIDYFMEIVATKNENYKLDKILIKENMTFKDKDMARRWKDKMRKSIKEFWEDEVE